MSPTLPLRGEGLLLGRIAGALLAFYFELAGPGIWWGFALGLMDTSILLTLRFHWITHHEGPMVNWLQW